MGYLTVYEVQSLADNADLDPTRLGFLIDSASAAIDNYCHRTFVSGEDTRSYDWQASKTLYLRDDVISVSEISNNGTVYTGDDVDLLPHSGPPYRLLQLKGTNTFSYSATAGKTGAVVVTGVWGYASDVPPAIKQACYQLVMWELNKFELGSISNVSAPGSLGVSFQADPKGLPESVLRYLRPYRKPRIDSLTGAIR